MADSFPNINFPRVDFSSLGALPALAEEAQGTEARKKALADLPAKMGVEDLRAAASRLLSGGSPTKTNIETAIRLLTAAQQQEANESYSKWITKLPATPLPGGTTGGAVTAPPIPYAPVTPAVPGPPAAATVPSPGFGPNPLAVPPPPVVAPQGALPADTTVGALPADTIPPVALNQNPAPPPGPPMLPIPGGQTPPITGPQPYEPYPGIPPGRPGQRIGLSPSDQLLAQAQGGLPPPPPRGPQYAQAGTPSVTVGPVVPVGPSVPAEAPGGVPSAPPPTGAAPLAGVPAAAPGLPSWMQGAQARPAVVPAAPAPAAPLPASDRPPGISDKAWQARQEAAQLGNQILSGPRTSANSGAMKLLEAQHKAALNRTEMSPDDVSYEAARIQSLQETGRDITRRQYDLDKQIGPERYKTAETKYKDLSVKGDQATELMAVLNRLQQIRNDPNFVSGGKFADLYGNTVKEVYGIARSLKEFGIDIPNVAGLPKLVERITDPHLKSAALMDEFKSLTAQALMSHVGSLSKGFSEGDRLFVEKQFPSLMSTPEGIDKVINNLGALANHAREITNTARDYMDYRQRDATIYGLDGAIERYRDNNPLFANKDGSLTPLGQQLVGSTRPRVGPFGGPGAGGYNARPTDLGGGPPPSSFGPVPTIVPQGNLNMPAQLNQQSPPPVGTMVDEYILPQHEGKVYYDQNGTPAGRVKEGKPVPFKGPSRVWFPPR
jgi:hypothetical protein